MNVLKQTDKTLKVVMSILAIITAVGIGGLFINGTFLNVVLLKLLPQVVHTIAGWTLVVGTLYGVIRSWMK
jgi:hypothetical protein